MRSYQFPVLLLPPGETTNEYNETIPGYPEESGINAWVDKQINEGREFWAAKKLNSELSGLMWMPFSKSFKIEPTWRVKDKMTGIVYDLDKPPIDSGEKRIELELHLKQVTQ